MLDFNNAPRQEFYDEPAPQRQAHSTMPSLQAAARALGGEVYGDRISCPGPGHRPKDRSLSVRFDPNAPDGFIVHPFAGEDALACKDYVREKLGLPPWQPRSSRNRNGAGSSGCAREKAPPEEPAKAASDSPFPEWTPPDPETGKPEFFAIGMEEPPPKPNELPGRRHMYRSHGQNVRLKVKLQDKTYRDYYRVRRPDTGETGWQPKKPKGYLTVPYISSVDPFDRDHADTPVFVTEGEKDTDSVARLGMPAMTFGSSSDKPEGCEMFVSGRDVVILADNDKDQERDKGINPGLKHAADLAVIFARAAKSVKVISFEQKDVSDWIEVGGTADELWRMVDAAQCAEPEEPTTPDGDERDNLLVSAWLDREPPPRDYLLGDVICTTSRWLIFGNTGVGKTLFAMSLAGAIACGSPFLNWEGRRKARVMYLDGELPAETFKDRMRIIAEIYGADIELYGYNREVLGPDEMPPLNAVDGRKWLLAEIEKVKPDIIFFDSIMCLLIGSMSEEESWAPMKPLVRAISAKRIAQVWLHHTGHDSSRGFGTKTREWEMDTVLALSKANDEDEEMQIKFNKARLRTPATAKQFEARMISTVNGNWSTNGKAPPRQKKARSDAEMIRSAILTTYGRLADDVGVNGAGLNGAPVRKVLVEKLRDEMKSRGLLETKETGGLTETARSNFFRAKAELLTSTTLVERDGWIWKP